MLPPGVKRFALLCLPIMSLIDARNSTLRTADVVQHRLGYLETDTQSLKTRSDCAPQIVSPPRRNFRAPLRNLVHRFIEAALGLGKTGDGLSRSSKRLARG